jgi:hypothetical protein
VGSPAAVVRYESGDAHSRDAAAHPSAVRGLAGRASVGLPVSGDERAPFGKDPPSSDAGHGVALGGIGVHQLPVRTVQSHPRHVGGLRRVLVAKERRLQPTRTDPGGRASPRLELHRDRPPPHLQRGNRVSRLTLVSSRRGPQSCGVLTAVRPSPRPLAGGTSAPNCSTAASSAPSLRPMMQPFPPSRTMRPAMARPIPRLAPVISATRPANC